MAKYPDGDPRADDLEGRIALLETMAFDADRVAGCLEKIAHENRADSELHAYLRRLGTCCRDFHGQVAAITASVSPSLRETIGRSPK